jgi:hypothetical protein
MLNDLGGFIGTIRRQQDSALAKLNFYLEIYRYRDGEDKNF